MYENASQVAFEFSTMGRIAVDTGVTMEILAVIVSSAVVGFIFYQYGLRNGRKGK